MSARLFPDEAHIVRVYRLRQEFVAECSPRALPDEGAARARYGTGRLLLRAYGNRGDLLATRTIGEPLDPHETLRKEFLRARRLARAAAQDQWLVEYAALVQAMVAIATALRCDVTNPV